MKVDFNHQKRRRRNMAWLTRSVANALRLDDDDEDAAAETAAAVEEVKKPANDAVLLEDRPRDSAFSIKDRRLSDSDGGASYITGGDEDFDRNYDRGRGVQEDLSEFRESITRQFWGVASFLAPPPPPPLPPPLFQRSGVESQPDPAGSVNADEEGGEEEEEELAEYYEREIGGLGETSNFSSSKDYDGDALEEEAVGITDEVLAFARNVAHHPETWLDYPIEEEEFDDFDLSNAQYKHALAVEQLAPRLAALRFELCPIHMSVGYFWMVYFVLLHSRLNKHDGDLLSSPQLVQARAMWLQELQKKTKGDSYWSGISTLQSKDSTDSPRDNIVRTYEDVQLAKESDWRSISESSTHQMTVEHEIEKHVLDEIEFIDKSVINEYPPPKVQDKEIVVGSSIAAPVPDDGDDEEDAWLKDDSDLIGYTSTSVFVNEDDISFSDLEDDFDSNFPTKSKTSSTERNRAAKTT